MKKLLKNVPQGTLYKWVSEDGPDDDGHLWQGIFIRLNDKDAYLVANKFKHAFSMVVENSKPDQYPFGYIFTHSQDTEVEVLE